jgi:hypothetical protein
LIAISTCLPALVGVADAFDHRLDRSKLRPAKLRALVSLLVAEIDRVGAVIDRRLERRQAAGRADEFGNAGCEGCRHFEPCLAYQREKELVKTSAGKHFTVEILEAVDGEKGSAGRLAKKKLDELEALIQKTSGIRLSNYSDIISAKKPRLSR